MSRWAKVRAAVVSAPEQTANTNDEKLKQNGVVGKQETRTNKKPKAAISFFTVAKVLAKFKRKKSIPYWMKPLGTYPGEKQVQKKKARKIKIHPKHEDSHDPRSKCCTNGDIFFNALKGNLQLNSLKMMTFKDDRYGLPTMISRQLFLLHSIIAIWRVAVVKGPTYWALCVMLVPLLGETIFLLFARQAKEWKWFSLSILIYMCNIIPCIWILELDKSLQLLGLQQTGPNGTATQTQEINPILSNDEWTAAIEQATLVLVVVCRWLMPRGEISRDQLSALLVTYIGIASDIVDFYNILAEDENRLRRSITFVTVVLAFWSWSLLQFCFVITATTDAKHELDNIKTKRTLRQRITFKISEFFESGAWATGISLFMQDGPFLIVRLIALLYYRVVTYTLYFFMTKNAMVMLINIYRIFVLHIETKEKKGQEQDNKKPYKDLYKNAFLYK